MQKAVGCALGDIVAQSLSGETANALRSLQLAVYGTLLDAPHIPALETSVSISPSSQKHSAAPKRAPAPADPRWMPAVVCLIAALIKQTSMDIACLLNERGDP